MRECCGGPKHGRSMSAPKILIPSEVYKRYTVQYRQANRLVTSEVQTDIQTVRSFNHGSVVDRIQADRFFYSSAEAYRQISLLQRYREMYIYRQTYTLITAVLQAEYKQTDPFSLLLQRRIQNTDRQISLLQKHIDRQTYPLLSQQCCRQNAGRQISCTHYCIGIDRILTDRSHYCRGIDIYNDRHILS